MRKLILISVLAFIFIPAQGQSSAYHPFPDQAVWRVDIVQNCPFQRPVLAYHYFHYSMDGDTLINAKWYKKIYRSFVLVDVVMWNSPSTPPTSQPPSYAGALREDSAAAKTFFVFPNSSVDSLLYDYNLLVGDTLHGCLVPLSGFSYYIVQSIDTVLIEGQPRRRWNFPNCEFSMGVPTERNIIEGMGSSAGLIEPICTYFYDWTSRHLVCVRDSSGPVYTTDYVSSFNCDPIIQSIEEAGQEVKVNCYPNPFTTQLNIQLSAPLQDLTLLVYNSMGQLVRQSEHLSGPEISLMREDLKNGIYTIQLSSPDAIVMSARVLVADQ